MQNSHIGTTLNIQNKSTAYNISKIVTTANKRFMDLQQHNWNSHKGTTQKHNKLWFLVYQNVETIQKYVKQRFTTRQDKNYNLQHIEPIS